MYVIRKTKVLHTPVVSYKGINGSNCTMGLSFVYKNSKTSLQYTRIMYILGIHRYIGIKQAQNRNILFYIAILQNYGYSFNYNI